MLDSIDHLTVKILISCIFGVKISRFSLILFNVIMDVITFPENLLTTSGLSILMHGVISLPDAMSCDKRIKVTRSVIMNIFQKKKIFFFLNHF